MLLKAIGNIRTPHRTLLECSGSAVEADGISRIEIFADYADGLDSVEAATHLILLYWLGEADRTRLRSPTRIDGRSWGVFANGSPARPNPIGISTVRLFAREGATLVVSGLDCLDQTPLLDIKPYILRLDRIDEASVEWMSRDVMPRSACSDTTSIEGTY